MGPRYKSPKGQTKESTSWIHRNEPLIRHALVLSTVATILITELASMYQSNYTVLGARNTTFQSMEAQPLHSHAMAPQSIDSSLTAASGKNSMDGNFPAQRFKNETTPRSLLAANVELSVSYADGAAAPFGELGNAASIILSGLSTPDYASPVAQSGAKSTEAHPNATILPPADADSDAATAREWAEFRSFQNKRQRARELRRKKLKEVNERKELSDQDASNTRNDVTKHVVSMTDGRKGNAAKAGNREQNKSMSKKRGDFGRVENQGKARTQDRMTGFIGNARGDAAMSHDNTVENDDDSDEGSSSTVFDGNDHKQFRGVVMKSGKLPDDAKFDNITRVSYMLYRLIKTHQIKSMVDIPCSNTLDWMPQVLHLLDFEVPGFQYYCVLASEEDKEKAQAKFGHSGSAEYIVVSEYWRTKLVTVDMAFMWNVLGFMSPMQSWQLIKNVRRSQTKYVVLPNYPELRHNSGSGTHHGRVNVRRAPYRFGEALRVFNNISSKPTISKQMLLYDVEHLRNDDSR
jgi:hypothetical protein